MFKSLSKRFLTSCCALAALCLPALPSFAGNVVIQEIYGAGGNANAVFNFDYVVLYNRSASSQTIAGWSLQYASATGNFGTANLKIDIPVGTAPLLPGQFYLIRLGSQNTAVGAALPVVPDLTSGNNATPNIGSTNGKLALVRNTTLLPVVACPLASPDIEDFVGFGTANCFEGAAAAPGGSGANAMFRKNIIDGCVDTDQNGADWDLAAPVCRNTTLFAFCSVACCNAAGACTIVASPNACNGTPLPNSACQPNPCPQPNPQGACCLPNNNCVFGSPTQCSANGGYYLGNNVACAGINCGLGACCTAAGACGQVVSAAVCNNGGGAFLGFGIACNPNPCTQPTGACCTTVSCFRVAEDFCVASGGNYAGDNTTCASVNCDTGACCRPDGTCVQANTAQACAQQGGTFLGLGIPCVPIPCAPTTGACCTAAGVCTLTTPGNCAGTFRGVGIACDATACKGPCCTTAGCTISAQSACTGAFQGFGVSCTPDPCPTTTTGACCLNTGGCTGVSGGSNGCNGLYLGDGTSCNPDPCIGVCCVGAICLSIGPSACGQLPFSEFVFTTLTCPGTTTTPCCKADFNHTGGITVQDIFDFLNAWFAASVAANINGGALEVQDIFDFLNAWFAGGC